MMSVGCDKLLDFLLSGIAIRDTEGASSADFRRLINEYYDQQKQKSSSGHGRFYDQRPKELSRDFYKDVWQWVTNHPDVRIYYKCEARSLSLSEFEALEDQDGTAANDGPAGGSDQRTGSLAAKKPAAARPTRSSNTLSSLGGSLRQRLLAEGICSVNEFDRQPNSPLPFRSNDALPGVSQQARKLREMPKNVQASHPAFNEPDASIRGPRIFTSQNRTWIAITGHSIDLNRVPGAEFVLLSIIARSGPSGIPQPVLQKLSGQDKRSVPGRTKALVAKGYIDKRSIQYGKARTSLLTHKMFLKHVSDEPKGVNDVFGARTLSLTGLLFLLNKLLETVDIVQVRHLRKKMGVTVERWNGRAVRGALIRLEQTKYLRRFTIEKKKKDDRLKSNHFICIQRLREPIEDDIKNLGFKRIAIGPSTNDAAADAPFEDENTGDGFMRDMELDLTNEASDEDEDFDVDRRIPPQWTPDRLLTNLVVDAIEAAGKNGTDAANLRDLITGFFWKRPIESLLGRLTDHWYEFAPLHTRHIAIIRDTAMASDKKRVHYLYRTHENFQKAVDAGEVTWDALELESSKKGARSKKQTQALIPVDSLGFETLNVNKFHRCTGSSTLAESCTAIGHNRRIPRDWESKLLKGESTRQTSSTPDQDAVASSNSPSGYKKRTPKSSKTPRPLLTQEQRVQLGLPAKGRLGAAYESQIRAYRKKTGDPDAVPPKLFEGGQANEPRPKPKYERRPGPPLLTQEERKARGLPVHGRLSFEVTKQILQEQGRNEPLTHMRGFLEAADPDDGEEQSHEGQRRESIDSDANHDDTMVLDNTGSGDSVSTPTNQPLNDTSTEAQATSQPLNTIAEMSAPYNKRAYQKRPIDKDGAKSGRLKKRMRNGSGKSMDQVLSIDEHPGSHGDDSAATHAVAAEVAQDGEPAHDAFEASLQSDAPEVKQDADRTSSILADNEAEVEISGSAAAPQTLKTSTKGRRGPYRKDVKQKPQVPLTKNELHVQAVKAQYHDRVEPGLYVDPFATKPGKGGRGRPRKMFMATFRLQGLRGLDWFVPDPTEMTSIPAALSTAPASAVSDERSLSKYATISPSPSATNIVPATKDATSAQLQTPAKERQSTEGDTEFMSPTDATDLHTQRGATTTAAQSIINTHQTESFLASTCKPINLGVPMEVDESSATLDLPSESVNESRGPVDESPMAAEQPPEVLDVAEGLQPSANSPEVRASNEQVITHVVEHDLLSEISVSEAHIDVANTIQESESAQLSSVHKESSRPSTAMENETSAPVPSDQSPSGPTPLQTPSGAETPNAAYEAAPVADRISQETASQDIPFVVDDNVSEVTASTMSAQKKDTKINRGVILGKGSVFHSRTRIIRHIFDLCGGVFPGTEVMYPVFTAAWEELGPKNIACPIPGTIRKALKSLCHPASDLKEVKFTIPRSDLPGSKTKYVYFYKHFEFRSPEVQQVVKGIVQAYPEKYCPPGVKQYWREEVKPPPMLPKIDNAYTAELYPPTSQKLDERIKEARIERRKLAREALEAKRRLEKAAKKEQRRLAKEQKRQEKLESSGSRQKLFKKRHRLVSLNDGLYSGVGNAAKQSTPMTVVPSLLPQQSREVSPTADYSEEESSINIRPHPQITTGDQIHATITLQDSQPALQPPIQANFSNHVAALIAPTIGYHSTTHTFSTDFVVGVPPESGGESKKKSRKRVRIEQSTDERASKRLRKSRLQSKSKAKQSEDDFLARHHIEIHESLGEDEDDDEDDEDEVALPTIAQRLAGLTGDLKQPDYEPQLRKRRPALSEPRDRRRRNRTRRKYAAIKDRKYPGAFDPLAEFRKLCYTLVIASSMAGEDGSVDWSIVTKVYSEAPRFDLEKTKKTWAWMQKRMTSQLQGMTGSFQSYFLSAYEEGKVDPIEDPNTYDWDRLVRWALLTCKHLEPPLPLAREALNDCQFDVSNYEILDRTVWYNTILANVNRDERFAKYTFGSPLHAKRKFTTPGDEADMKARSLIRANISTPKELYDKTVAHDKLRKLPEPVIGRSVNDLLRASLIKQRKIKRLLPGRNYHFASHFAKHYRRTFELSDFMNAVKLKKDLDTTFLESDPDKRTYFVSRAAENGIVMALISLASEGKVKLVPQLPPIKNEFDAPLPRISVWGFSEGDYQHRLMDRKRLFWPLIVVPTESYEYGNPLRPTPSPPASTKDLPATWDPMPEPPLPARNQHPDALLPIWSTIDGRKVVYPWWNRILNIVIQALLFQPSITAQDIFARCETYTTEIFELQLVLDWLVDVKAAKRSPHGTYNISLGYWAVFGDRLIDEEMDEFGEHVKRLKTNRKLVPTWRTEYNNEYNLRSAALQQSSGTAEGARGEVQQDNGTSAGAQILGNVRKQYTIAKHVLEAPTSESQAGDTQHSRDGSASRGGVQAQSQAALEQGVESATSTPAFTPAATPSTATQDVEMMDVNSDLDAEGEDIDAEGESDDEYF